MIRHLSLANLDKAPPPAASVNAFVNKISRVVDISQDDASALQELSGKARDVKAGKDLIGDGDEPNHVILILGGWACRYKILKNGTRQITAFMLPGDLCDMHVMLLDHMDHGIAAITEVNMALVSREQLHRLTMERPNLLRALWWSTLVDEGILRAWIVNNGRRSARERIAHLICELHKRINNIGLAEGEDFRLPLSQIEIADAVAMTPMHVNRTIEGFADSGLVKIIRGKMMVLDIAGLERIADFDESYLHVQRLRATDTLGEG